MQLLLPPRLPTSQHNRCLLPIHKIPENKWAFRITVHWATPPPVSSHFILISCLTQCGLYIYVLWPFYKYCQCEFQMYCELLPCSFFPLWSFSSLLHDEAQNKLYSMGSNKNDMIRNGVKWPFQKKEFYIFWSNRLYVKMFWSHNSIISSARNSSFKQNSYLL